MTSSLNISNLFFIKFIFKGLEGIPFKLNDRLLSSDSSKDENVSYVVVMLFNYEFRMLKDGVIYLLFFVYTKKYLYFFTIL